jgi:gamma-tubulin complex component 2
VQFMDSAADELRKDIREVGLSRVQTLLGQAVLSCTVASDPNKDEVSCFLAPHTLIQHLHLIQSAGDSTSTADFTSSASTLGPLGFKGIESVTLDYKVGWPVSLLLSRRAITKYQLLSRLLFYSKHVELRILGVWSEHQRTKALNVRAGLASSFCLRQRMLHFLQNFIYYVTLEVIGPRGVEMQASMTRADDMDEVKTCPFRIKYCVCLHNKLSLCR